MLNGARVQAPEGKPLIAYLHPVYTAQQLASLFPEGNHQLPDPTASIQHICIDSRKAAWQPNAIFLALQGARID